VVSTTTLLAVAEIKPVVKMQLKITAFKLESKIQRDSCSFMKKDLGSQRGLGLQGSGKNI